MRDKYNNTNIKPYKGRMVSLEYRVNGYKHDQTGEIIASTRNHIVFDVNKSGKEIMLTYAQIKGITEPVLTV